MSILQVGLILISIWVFLQTATAFGLVLGTGTGLVALIGMLGAILVFISQLKIVKEQ